MNLFFSYNSNLKGMIAAIRELKQSLPDDNIVIGNGLQNYDFNAGHGNPSYDIFVDVLDGFCMEHVMAFEVTML